MVQGERGRRRRTWLAGLGVAALAAVALAALWPGAADRRSSPVPGAVAKSAAAPAPAVPQTADGNASPTLPPPPRSLRGTRPSGGFALDAAGHLAPTPDALRLFDYFLSASGEEPPAVIRARIVAEIDARLTAPARGEAVALLDTYLDYREALRDLTAVDIAPAELERRLQWVRELRRGHFGAETAEALFGNEEAALRIQLERRALQQDPSLSEAERARSLEALEQQLPPEIREARRRAIAPSRTRDEVEALRRDGAGDAEVFELREERLGREAAERLAALDRDRNAWQTRYARYGAERDALLADPDLDPDARGAAIAALRAAHFEAEERARVEALDQIRAAP